MYNPDELKKASEAKAKREQVRQTPSNAHNGPVVLMDRKDWFRHYLKESSAVREGYGFGMIDKKLVIVDRAKLERFDGETKAILREIYLEMK